MNKYLDETGLAYFWGKIKSAMPAAQVQADWNQTNTSAADYIKNKPSIPTIPDLVKGTTTGNGNAVTDINVSGHTITLTKGTTFLTSHQDISGKQDKVAKLGSSTKPLYTSAAGTFSECSIYAGGTAVTLNGTSKAANTASFYAPTSAGTSGQYLKSNGSGAPSWDTLPTLSKGTTTGSGNAVTDISVSGHTITLTKGSTFLTSHQDISGKEDKITSHTNVYDGIRLCMGIQKGGYTTTETTNAEWTYVLVDSADKVLAGVRQDGSLFIAEL